MLAGDVLLRRSRSNAARPSGGVAVVVAMSLPANTVQVQTALEVVAVQIYLDRLITLSSVYFLPSYTLAR